MLAFPQIASWYSADQSNVDELALADWLEAIVLFDETRVSKNAVVDILLEEQICPSDAQDLAYEIATDGWAELLRRQRWGGIPASVTIDDAGIEIGDEADRSTLWQFFVLLSVLKLYPDWAERHRNYTVQGDTFERVVDALCPVLLPGWESYRTGWSPNETKDIPGIVRELCKRLNVSGAANLSRWVGPKTKDGGLDIVCYRPFADAREALPTFFLQCASGRNWRDKVHTPNADTWQKYLDAAVKPSTGIVAPFVVDDKDLRLAALTGQVIVLDRLRMLSATRDVQFSMEEDLCHDVQKRMQPRVDDLPRVW